MATEPNRLKQMSGPAPRVDEGAIAPMRLAHERARPSAVVGVRMRWTWLGIRQ